MKKIKNVFLLISLSSLMFGCVSIKIPFNYTPTKTVISKIEAQTKISVNLKSIDMPPRAPILPNLESDIKQSITNDLRENIFPLIVEINPDLNVQINIEKLKFKAPIAWTYFFPIPIYGPLLGLPSNILKGEVDIRLEIFTKDGKLLGSYSSKREIKKYINGLYYGGKYLIGGREFWLATAFSQVMNDIKLQINEDRQKIETAFKQQKSIYQQQLNSRIENTTLELNGDKLIIKYDINGSEPIDIVWLEITTLSGNKIDAHSFTGDVGSNINAGKGKQIIWDMKKDNIDLQGQEINVTVKGK